MGIKKYVQNKIENFMAIKKQGNNGKYNWSGSSYEKFKVYCSIDDRGQIGEEIIKELAKGYNAKSIDYNKNKITGDYDIIINGKKIEIKTATIGVNGSFQHESLLPNRDYDYVIFLSFLPEDFYITVVSKKDIIFDEKEKGKGQRKLHKRTSGLYKCDFRINELEKGNIKCFKKEKIVKMDKGENFIEILKYIDNN